jgi:hypothetical protein
VAGWTGLRESAVGLVDFVLLCALALLFWAALMFVPLRKLVRRIRRPAEVWGFFDTSA